MQAPDLLDLFVAPLERSGIEYMVTGSVASTLYGEPRLTHDVDMVLVLHTGEVDRFRRIFPDSDYYCPPADIIRIELNRKGFTHFNLIHHETGYKADCYPYTGNPLHEWALERRMRFEIHPGLTINVAPPEYVIIRKLQYFREGGSEKHLTDIRKMIVTPGFKLDGSSLKSWISRLGLDTVWAKTAV